MTILIKNGRIITDVEDYTADIFIENGKTAPLFHALTRPAAMEGEAINRSLAFFG